MVVAGKTIMEPVIVLTTDNGLMAKVDGKEVRVLSPQGGIDFLQGYVIKYLGLKGDVEVLEELQKYLLVLNRYQLVCSELATYIMENNYGRDRADPNDYINPYFTKIISKIDTVAEEFYTIQPNSPILQEYFRNITAIVNYCLWPFMSN